MSRYIGKDDYVHGSEACAGVLLVNLGTPDAPTPAALRRYLGEFLWDPRVVETPRALWWLILHGAILRLRPKRSAKLYREIWTEAGSPLLAISRRQAEALQRDLRRRFAGPVHVELAMRYGNPSIPAGLEALRQRGVRRLLVLPAYPQYSATTTGSTFDAVTQVLRAWRWVPELRFANQYADDDAYLQAQAARIRAYWAEHGRGERLVFSFHGIPKRYLLNGDPYHCQCQQSARRVAEILGLASADWQVCFQSRFGREEWLQPYLDETLKALPARGIKSVDVCCPGFAADCLETLEEIDVSGRALFLEAGGKRFGYIPALNDMPAHIEALGSLVGHHTRGWPETSTAWDATAARARAEAARSRALAAGAER